MVTRRNFIKAATSGLFVPTTLYGQSLDDLADVDKKFEELSEGRINLEYKLEFRGGWGRLWDLITDPKIIINIENSLGTATLDLDSKDIKYTKRLIGNIPYLQEEIKNQKNIYLYYPEREAYILGHSEGSKRPPIQRMFLEGEKDVIFYLTRFFTDYNEDHFTNGIQKIRLLVNMEYKNIFLEKENLSNGDVKFYSYVKDLDMSNIRDVTVIANIRGNLILPKEIIINRDARIHLIQGVGPYEISR